MSLSTPNCPSAGEALILSHRGDLDLWVCPSAHGAAVTLTETYHQLQEDEIHELWQLARAASSGPRGCPMCARPMAAIDAPYDADEIEERALGDVADDGSALLDVCVECQVIWFDAGEFERFPTDLTNAAPTEAEDARLAQIRSAFGEQIERDLRERNSDVTDRAYALIARHPKALGVLSSLGGRVLPDFRP